MKKVLYRRPDTHKSVSAITVCDNGELALLYVPAFDRFRTDFILLAQDDDNDGVYEDAEANWFQVTSKQTLEMAEDLKALGSDAL